MWLFRRKGNRQPEIEDVIILRVFLDTEELGSFTSSGLPAEQQPVAELKAEQQFLHFFDSTGNARSFDLSSVFSEGGRFLHMSIRVGRTFAVESDCIVTRSEDENPHDTFQSGATLGIRFQPFMLPEFTKDTSELVGKGLFYRGLHFSGTVTPGNVSVLCLCDYCRKSFQLQSFHAGFGQSTYLYCSGGPHTLVASSYIADAPPVLGEADMESVARFERRLPKCVRVRRLFSLPESVAVPTLQEAVH